MKKIDVFLLKNRDLISFTAGLIVSGFIVGLALSENFHYLYWLTIGCGIFFAIASFILSQIKAKLDRYIITNKKLNPTATEKDIFNGGWEDLNTDKKENKIFRKLSNFWMIVILFVLIISPVLGIGSFFYGRAQLKEEYLQEQNKYKEQLISDIKEVNSLLIDTLFIEKQSILDSLQQKKEKIKFLEIQVDSLNNVLKKRLQNQLKANEKRQ